MRKPPSAEDSGTAQIGPRRGREAESARQLLEGGHCETVPHWVRQPPPPPALSTPSPHSAQVKGHVGAFCFQETRYPHSNFSIRAIIGGAHVVRPPASSSLTAWGQNHASPAPGVLIGWTAFLTLSNPTLKILLTVFIPNTLIRIPDKFCKTS